MEAVARNQSVGQPPAPRWRDRRRGRPPLAANLEATEREVRKTQAALEASLAAGQPLSPAGAWMLDNVFVVLEQVHEIRAALPRGYYRDLPKLTSGPNAGYPRVYEIAVEFIAHTDGRLDAQSVELVLAAFQRVSPLTMGELWAMPAMLRLGFLENVRRVGRRARDEVREVAAADAWVARFTDAAARDDRALGRELAEFVDATPRLTPAFITRFVQQMRVRRADFTPLLWLEQWIAEEVMTVEEAVEHTTQDMALAQLAIANSITSLRTVPDLEWPGIFERQSASEAVLREDPAGIYPSMSFATRDRYRHVVERLARGSIHTEPEVAAAAVKLARASLERDTSAHGARAAHVGFYLVDHGYRELAERIGETPNARARITRAILRHPTRTYFGSLVATTIVGLLAALALVGHDPAGSTFAIVVIASLAAFPMSEVAVAIVNQLVMLLVPPTRLPRMDFRRGVPPTSRTLVVVPVLLPSVQAVKDALSHLETQFLANRDSAIRFALLSDVIDAEAEVMPSDAAIIAAASDGIRSLNTTYGSDEASDVSGGAPFYLLHRPRRWNAADEVWMGWERKRGKLAELNDLLCGVDRAAFSSIEGDVEWLHGVRYVITLDADTVLPRDSAAALIGSMAHPLNRPEFDEQRGVVTRGYGIMQPRVSVSLQSANASRFAAIYAGHVGLDPYTTAVSDVYQDLFSEGTFTGKGIYDVAVFRHSTQGRFPENAVLSHDLIEGAFARAGLVTDVEVFDDYPSSFDTTIRRTHRWIRGDWQLLPWLSSMVPGREGLTENPLSALSRWKIVDNLRRSVVSIAVMIWIAAAWLLSGVSPIRATAVALAALVAPWLISPLVAAFRPPRGHAWRPYYSAVAQDGAASMRQAGLAVLLLPIQAGVAADAILRTLVRVLGSRRRLLEWQTAAHVEQHVSAGRTPRLRLVIPGVALSAAMAAVAVVSLTTAPAIVAYRVWLPLSALAAGWLLSLRLVRALARPTVRADLSLHASQRTVAQGYAGLHWTFFERFAQESTHWLVPDNFQETPTPVVAPRTSPTNIGLQLLSTVAAYDLAFISLDAMLERLERALNTMDQLRRFRGHFFNWYDLSDLRVLDPPYISTVDSGNLAGHLIALAQACLAMTGSGGDEAGAALPQDGRLRGVAMRARTMAMEMDFRLLYDERRKLFAIGYDDRSAKTDTSAYDLLATEARLASFVAIAKGDVPAEHWFRLGRSLTVRARATALVSWSGSMFEYLMPTLVMPSRANSLLDQTCRSAVVRQIAYSDSTQTPWGISESAYNRRDIHGTYQYRAFGVPDLALKRGLNEDVVIAPYASMLALAFDPHQAMENLHQLERLGALGEYGFLDSLDYTRPEPGEPFALVRTFMAHHIGMSLVALDNALHLDGGDGLWQRRFMTDPAMRGAALLLDERVPRVYVPLPPQTAEPRRAASALEAGRAAVRRVGTAGTPEPQVGLLGGSSYRVLLTNSGAGHSSSGPIAVTRWRADATRDDTGQWIYVSDLTGDRVWSAGHQPTGAIASEYSVTFAPDRITFARRDGEVETSMDVAVVPHERTEIRRVTLANRSDTTRELELTSYAEVVLGSADADRAHPAFQNLFIETEWAEDHSAILASRRPRSAGERRRWCAHSIATSAERLGAITCETDRARFVGRGRTTRAPRALDRECALTGTTGAVLDPIFALRVRLRLEPGQSETVTFTTVVADSRDEALGAADRYRGPGAAERALSLAATETQVELRELGIAPAEAALYQELAGALIYPNDALRAPESERAAGLAPQRNLWAHGISGDHPIVLATIHDPVGLPSVRQLLVMHKYWRMKGVTCDLVILNTNAPSYFQALHDQLIAMGIASSEGSVIDKPGGVFIRRPDAIPPADAALLRCLARIHIECDGIGIGDIVELARVNRPPSGPPLPPTRQVRRKSDIADTTPDPLHNGFGEVSPEGDYRMRVGGAHVPPAPWCNVIANPNAGFCVTERGGGFAWAENSYLYRLTPWHNDPVADPFGEVLYLRDDMSGDVWTPTPGPSPAVGERPDTDTYVVRHGAGSSVFENSRHGITTELTMAVPVSDPVKITRLRITNTRDARRRISLTSYVEWVLGSQREQTRHHVVTRHDKESGAIFASNYFHDDFADQVAFSWISEPVMSFTSDRDEFIGRNGDLTLPAAMKASTLSGRTGVGLDPCAGLRTTIDLEPGESRDVIVLLGAARSVAEARAVIERNATGQAIEHAVEVWRDRLSAITVRTPSPELDVMVNKWWLYQALACRMWGRSALYQSSGAFGFRDQLQDCMAFVYAEPKLAREHLLRAAGHQFPEGDVQHWWHEPSMRGVRTRFSDDLAWLPFVADHYVTVTGDTAVWDEIVPFIEMRPLAPGEHEAYDTPRRSNETATLFEHCRRALDKACTVGVHGLPLFGAGDWNDGMNHVGIDGRGESVWLAWFLIANLRRFGVHAASRGAHDMAADMQRRARDYASAVEAAGWDGQWYRRGYFDDGTPLGSSTNAECQIDSIAQSWSVLSGAGDPTRARRAMQSMHERLVDEDARLIKLLAPPFDHSDHNPGYIMGYVPGVRENGAQYTHAALWTVMAAAELGDGDRAMHYLDILNPLTHARTETDVGRYRVEPYVACADVYAAPAHLGRGGWTWYTGSASLSYRAALESVLGFVKHGNELVMNPCIPRDWREFSITYRHKSATYEVVVENPDGATRGIGSVDVDGVPAPLDSVQLVDDGAVHRVVIRMADADVPVALAASEPQ